MEERLGMADERLLFASDVWVGGCIPNEVSTSDEWEAGKLGDYVHKLTIVVDNDIF